MSRVVVGDAGGGDGGRDTTYSLIKAAATMRAEPIARVVTRSWEEVIG